MDKLFEELAFKKNAVLSKKLFNHMGKNYTPCIFHVALNAKQLHVSPEAQPARR